MPKKQASIWGQMKGKHEIRIPLRFIAKVAGVTYGAARWASRIKRFERKNLYSIVAYINRTRKKKELPELL